MRKGKKNMCKIVHVAAYIVDECIDNDIPINYYKVQKLAYLSQCRHLGKYGVPLAPETVWNWSCGAGFKEIYHFFSDNDLLDGDITKPFDKELDLLFFEKDTINSVLDDYGGMSFEDLTALTKTDVIFSELEVGSSVPLSKITNYFI